MIMFCRSKVSRKSFKIFFKDISAMNKKHMQHTTVSQDMKVITNMETDEATDSDYVSKHIVIHA